MLKTIKYILLALALAVHLGLAGLVNFAFPHYQITQVTGVEVKRVNQKSAVSGATPVEGVTRDVYFIYTQQADASEPVVYRNEDTRWGLPPYFKFDAPSVQAKAANFAAAHSLVEIKYYGWDAEYLSEFRNVVSIEPVSADATPSRPILSYLFYAFFAFTFFLSVQFIRGWFDTYRPLKSRETK